MVSTLVDMVRTWRLLLIHQTRLQKLWLHRVNIWCRLRASLNLHLRWLHHHHVLGLRCPGLHHLIQIPGTKGVLHATWLRNNRRPLGRCELILLLLHLHLHILQNLARLLHNRLLLVLILHLFVWLLLSVRGLVGATWGQGLYVASTYMRLSGILIRRHRILSLVEEKLHVDFALICNNRPLRKTKPKLRMLNLNSCRTDQFNQIY